MRFYNGYIYCSKNPRENLIEIGSYYYEIQPLSEIGEYSKGANSCVFKLFDGESAQIDHLIPLQNDHL